MGRERGREAWRGATHSKKTEGGGADELGYEYRGGGHLAQNGWIVQKQSMVIQRCCRWIAMGSVRDCR